jgi:molecular chaperone GrpE
MSKHHKDTSKHEKHEKQSDEKVESSFADMAEALGIQPEESKSVTELNAELEQAHKKAEEAFDKFMRTQAEMDNLRKRTERDIANAHKFALEKFVKELLPVMDSIEQGLSIAVNNGEGMAAMREGMELTYKMLLSTLTKFGVEQLDPVDKPYDPHQHEAMSMVEVPNVAPNMVLQVIQKGYTLHGRLVRPARVIISRGES